MTTYFFIGLLLILFLFCLIKNLPAYSYFTDGAKEGINICVSSFPYLVAIFIAVELFRVSGLSTLFANIMSPILSFFNVPPQLGELIIIKPFSGSGSTAILNDCIETYGPNSYIAKCAATIMNTSETLFYITAVYFGQVGPKKLAYTVLVCLFSSFVGAIVACAFCRVF